VQWYQLADDVAVLRSSLRGFGIDFGRNVTLLRLSDGRLVVHSTAPFLEQDIAAIRRFGKPSWIVEATRMHDTFAQQARAALADIPYLAPAGFARVSSVATQPLIPPPAEWSGELDVLPVAGLRLTDEHVFYHRRSRTLVVADLLFHFPPETRRWPRFFVRSIMQLPRLRGISVFFRMMIRDRAAFAISMKRILEWDFTQIVLAHREPIREEAKVELVQALRDAGFSDRRQPLELNAPRRSMSNVPL